MNPYHQFVSQFEQLIKQGPSLPLGKAAMPQHPAPGAQAAKVLIFSPHPDDEVIVGPLPLRFLRQSHLNVINVAVTQGSNKARQSGRWEELTHCCRYIGFGLLQTQPGGLEGINTKARANNPAAWSASVERIAQILSEHQPKAIFFPHAEDWNSSHIGTHYLVMDALARMPSVFNCLTFETEFWGAMDAPNLMVESSVEDIADLLTALSFHVGEVQRNPYHVRFPAWLIDNVRRGAELVGGQGGASPDFAFATLYRLRRWKNQRLEDVLDKGRLLGRQEEPGALLRQG